MAAGLGVGGLAVSSLITDPGRKAALHEEFQKDYFIDLQTRLAADYNRGVQVFPPKDLIFNAFNVTPIDKVKIVILGQDPYHNYGQAMGMSFSVPDGVPIPPSLRNIYKALSHDENINFQIPNHGNLEYWVKQGMLLLNTVLTVEANKPRWHAKYGWQIFTDRVIQIISENCKAVVFILLGNLAHKKEKLIDTTKHRVIKTAHPTSRKQYFQNFLNSNFGSKADAALVNLGLTPMDWQL